MLVRNFYLAVVAFSLASCATVNFNYPKPQSAAFTDTGDTYLGKRLKQEVTSRPTNHSGFYLISDGIDALSARLLMAERAERSIDAQYYELKNDLTGRVFIAALLRAADRGVRVRLLIDDVTTVGYDAGMGALDEHPNFEIRVFNPFANRRWRILNGLTDFSRVNRRMHNKSFTVDNQITLFGGRNIGDEYFAAREDAIFFDLDVVAIGSIVNDVSRMFDEYWNHERAAPLPAFANKPIDPPAHLVRLRKQLEDWRQEIINTDYAVLAKEKYLAFEKNKSNLFTWAPFQLIYDSPDKVYKSKAKVVEAITTPIRASMLDAQQEIIIISPYFVILKPGINALADLKTRGVDITIITNSRAANNQALVHAGYAPTRVPLLKHGIKMYEVRPSAQVLEYETVDTSSAKATLHTKAFIVDNSQLFVGSFNFDQRSANINTELGAIIESPLLAKKFANQVNSAIAEKAFELFLNEYNGLRWRAFNEGEEVIYSKEPHTNWWQRLHGSFLQMLPIKGQL